MVRHWRSARPFAPGKGRNAGDAGIILRRSENGKVYFNCQLNGRFSRYVVTKKGETWLEEQGYPVGSRIDRYVVQDLLDFGHIQLSPSLTPARERQRETENTKARRSGFSWAEYVGYDERFGNTQMGQEPEPVNTSTQHRASNQRQQEQPGRSARTITSSTASGPATSSPRGNTSVKQDVQAAVSASEQVTGEIIMQKLEEQERALPSKSMNRPKGVPARLAKKAMKRARRKKH